MIKKELKSHLGAENVVVRDCTLAPGAILGSFSSPLFVVLAVLLNISMGRFTGVSPWVTAMAASVLSILSILLLIFEFSSALSWSIHFSRRKGRSM